MQIVIDIDEKDYQAMKNGHIPFNVLGVLMSGTPLPKGHGRIGDLDAVLNDISTSINEMTNIGVAVNGEYLWAKLNDAIDDASTIIEADVESE